VTKTNAASAVATSSTTTMDGHNNNNSNNLTMNEHTGIEHIVTLSRGTNERIINAVKFSPNGRYLVAAGDSGTVVSYALPSSSISSSSNPMNNNLNYWTSIEKETDLNMKMLFNHSDDVMDISWSADSKRFVVCSLDHTLTVWENYTTHTTGTTTGGGGGGGGSNSSDDGNNWRSVHRSNKDHTHYIQGVTYDPKGVYLASMGSDRMVKVYTRKEISDRTLSAELAKYEIEENTTVGRPEAMEEESGVDSEERHGSRKGDGGDKVGIIRESKLLPGLLTNSTFALQNKIKTMKFLTTSNGKSTGGKDHRTSVDSSNGTTDMLVDEKDKGDSLKSTSITNAASAAAATTKRHHMFADELTLGSFFRRLSFTTDGAFLVVPAALWHGMKSTIEEKDSGAGGGVGHPRSPTSVSSSSMSESSFCTYLFARHHFDQPYKVLTGLEKPSVVIRPNPVLFQLPPSAASSLASSSSAALPYRSIFAVLTTDTVVIYLRHTS
jgi:chromatin assembly factor 1 subunit B